MVKAKSIFRYPGGKYKAVRFIKPFWEQVQHSEYREPFIGGGSVFIAKPSVETNWINDIDKDLISFYKIISQKIAIIKDFQRTLRKTIFFKTTKYF